MNEPNIVAASETISVVEARNLQEVVHTMRLGLTYAEYVEIMAVFGRACDRILKENEVE
jgi:hypothetical protein